MLATERKEIIKQLSSMPCPMILSTEDEYVVKSVELSLKARQEGNLLYQQKNHDSKVHERIWEKYSKSIALAPNHSNELALGYGNRSALLLHLQKYDDCIKDIDRAISISNSNSFKVKLICRKIKCQAHLNLSCEEALNEIENLLSRTYESKGEKKALHDMVNKTITYKDEMKLKEIKNVKETKIFTLKNTVDDFSAVAVKYHSQKGKYLVATRDFKPGEVILVETIYAKVMDYKKAYAFCAHCLEQCWSLIPCPKCHLSMYCSNECRREAWKKYHDIECALISGTQSNTQFDYFHQLGLRTLILGVREAGGISKLEAQLKSCNEDTPWDFYMKNNKVQSLGFISLYNLSSYIVEPISKIFCKFCSLFALLLAKRTNFFGKKYTWMEGIVLLKDSNFIFVASLLLKLVKISMASCRSLANKHMSYKDDHCEKELDFGYCTRGAYMTPISNLTSHSCNPNVNRSCVAVNKIALYALQPIKKNSVLYETQCNAFYELPKEVREQFLIVRHQNSCNCIACKNDWPPFMMSCEKHIDAKAHEYADDFYKDKVEKKIYKFSEEAIVLSGYEESMYREDLIENLAKSIATSLKVLQQPSRLTCDLIIALKKIFDRMYGIKFTIPIECADV